eukprot:1083327_1
MDMVNNTELISCAELLIRILKADQLKTVLFVGLNYIRHQLTYEQLFQMKDTYKTIIESKQNLRPKSCEDEDSNLIVPTAPLASGASLSETVPIDIIRIHICSFLDLLSIYEFSKCDRNLAIVAHTPSSIRTLQFNYLNHYPYAITSSAYHLDADHLSHHQDLHLIRNISALSIRRTELYHSKHITASCNKLQHIHHLKHLTIYDEFREDYDSELGDCDSEHLVNSWDSIYHEWPLIKSLESITFESSFELPILLSILHKYRINRNDLDDTYHESMFKLKCISFVRCHFYSLHFYESYLIYDDPHDDYHFEPDLSRYLVEYETILELLVPSRTNRIEALKFEQSFFLATSGDHDAVNEAFSDSDRLSSSLSCLKGIVYSDCQEKHLSDEYEQQQDIFCVTVSVSVNGLKLIKQLTDVAHNGSFNIEKLCLVINVPSTMNKQQSTSLITMIEAILSECQFLELFQIVFKIQNPEYLDGEQCDECESKFDVVYHLCEQINSYLMSISVRESKSVEFAKRKLTSRFHIKSSHYAHTKQCSVFSYSKSDSKYRSYKCTQIDKLMDLLRTLSISYLGVFTTGKVIYKFSWNSKFTFCLSSFSSVFGNILSLNGIFDIQYAKRSINKAFASGKHYRPCIHDCRDHAKECISLQCKSDTNCVDPQNNLQWVTDCSNCDNRPWL